MGGFRSIIITEVEKPVRLHDTKFTVHQGTWHLNNFNTREALERWCKLTGIELEEVEVAGDERLHRTMPECGWVKTYFPKQQFADKEFSDINQIPKNAVKCKGLATGSIVDCYVLVDGDKTTIYRPNPNSVELYKPMNIKEHANFVRDNGYLNSYNYKEENQLKGKVLLNGELVEVTLGFENGKIEVEIPEGVDTSNWYHAVHIKKKQAIK